MSIASSETAPRLPVIYWVGCAALGALVLLRALDIIEMVFAGGGAGILRQSVALLVGVGGVIGLFSRKVSSFRWAKFLLAAAGAFGIFVAVMRYLAMGNQLDHVELVVAGINVAIGLTCICIWLLMEMQSYGIENALNPN